MKKKTPAFILCVFLAFSLMSTVCYADLAENPRGSEILDNYQTIAVNNGTIDDNYAEVTTNNGEIRYNSGEVTTNETAGTVYFNTMISGQTLPSTVITNKGLVLVNECEVINNTGTVYRNYGTVVSNTGVVVNYTGTVEANSAQLNVGEPVQGTVYNAGTALTDQSGIEYFLVNVEGGDVTGLTEYDNEQWILSSYNNGAATLSPVNGQRFSGAPTIIDGVGQIEVSNGIYTLHDASSVITLHVYCTAAEEQAIWLVKICVDPNGGGGEMPHVNILLGAEYALPECTLTPPEGMRFKGWSLESGEGELYAPGDIITVDNWFELYPVWEAAA